LLSCLIYTDTKGEGKISKDESIVKAYNAMQPSIEKVADVMIDSKIELDKEAYIKKFSPEIMEITIRWCQGTAFK
jgi:superfamily II RNA helicase